MNADPIGTELLRTRAMLAMSFAVARYVPIPFVDDVVRQRIALSVLRRAALARGHVLEKEALGPLSTSSDGCLGCLLSALLVPLKLILFPIRTLLSIVLGVRWMSRDLLEVLALGRTLDRLLLDARFPLAEGTEVQAAFAREARRAFDQSLKGLDTHAVRGVLAVALGPLGKLVPSALRAMGRASREEAPDASSMDAPASRIVHALESTEVRALLETFDQRFDSALLAIRAAGRDR